MPQTRRRILQGAGIGLLSYTLGGRTVLLTPAQARSHGVPLQVLTSDEAATLETLGEALVPGAAEAGVVQFVDQQLSVDANNALLMARYLNVEPPYVNFYSAAIAAVHAYSRALSPTTEPAFPGNGGETHRRICGGTTQAVGGTAFTPGLHSAPRRCRGRGVRHRGGFRAPGRALPAPHSSAFKLVNAAWQHRKRKYSL